MYTCHVCDFNCTSHRDILKMTEIVPRGGPGDERYTAKKHATFSTDEGLDARDIHLFPNMHIIVTFVSILSLYALMFVGFVIGDFWGSTYFSVGVPVTTRDVDVTKKWEYWLLISIIVWDVFFEYMSNRVIGCWRVNVLINPGVTTSYSKSMFVLSVHHMVGFLRVAVMILFVTSQVGFALSYICPSLIIIAYTSTRSVMRRNAKYAAQKDDDDVNQAKPDVYCPTAATSMWNVDPIVIICFELLEVALFTVVFAAVGYFNAPFFKFSAPFTLFGEEFTSNVQLWVAVLFVFLDTLLSTVYRSVVTPYITGVLENETSEYTQMDDAGATYVYVSNRAITWIRTIFMLNFILSKIPFLLAMFVADSIVTNILTHRQLMTLDKFKSASEHRSPTYDTFTYKQLSLVRLTRISLIEMALVIIFGLAVIKIYKFDYFNWPPPLIIFDTLVASDAYCWYIIVYTVLDRIVNTLSSDIVLPYIVNTLEACDVRGHYYEPIDTFMIVFVFHISNWARRIVSYNFMYSSFSLVLFQALTDICVSYIIVRQYLYYKKKQRARKNDTRIGKIRGLFPNVSPDQTCNQPK